jgi:methyl-accepting chemotaxis protein
VTPKKLPDIESVIEQKAADDPTFAVAFALLRLADAADSNAESLESIATSLAVMAKTVRVRSS